MRILSVNLAHRDPRDLGIAVLRAEDLIHVDLVRHEKLGLARPLDPESLADALVGLAESSHCSWIAVDGPSGWKDPDNGLVHSRVCDRELNAPAKVGLPGEVKPRSYTIFVKFSIALFDRLSARGYARLCGPDTPPDQPTSVEILPLACWSRFQLQRLPAKSRCTTEALAACTAALGPLVSFDVAPSHDELQATIGGIAVLWLLLGQADRVLLAGRAPFVLENQWREGFIVVPATLPRGGA